MKLPKFLVLFLCLALFGLLLPSCEFMKGVPVRIGIQTRDADFGYSSKGGLVVSGKVPTRAFPIYREK